MLRAFAPSAKEESAAPVRVTTILARVVTYACSIVSAVDCDFSLCAVRCGELRLVLGSALRVELNSALLLAPNSALLFALNFALLLELKLALLLELSFALSLELKLRELISQFLSLST